MCRSCGEYLISKHEKIQINSETPMYCQIMDFIRCREPDSPIYHIDIDFDNIREFDAQLYENMTCYPKEMLDLCDRSLSEVYHIFCGQNDPRTMIPMEVRPFHKHTTHQISELTPDKIDTSATIAGTEYIKRIVTLHFDTISCLSEESSKCV